MLNNNIVNYDDPISYLTVSKKTSDYLTKKKKYFTMGDILNKTEGELSLELPFNIFEEVKLAIESMGLAFKMSLKDEKNHLQSEINEINSTIARKENLYNKLVEIYNDSVGCRELVNLIIERERLIKLNNEMDEKIDEVTNRIVNSNYPQKTL